MRRTAFLSLTGLSVENHTAMVRRGSLPYAEDERSGWADYSLMQAVATVIALDLSKAGVDQQTASATVVRADSEIMRWIPVATMADGNGPDIWLAVVRFTYDGGDRLITRDAVAVAPLSHIHTTKTEVGSSIAELERAATSVVLTNISRALRDVKNRALNNGLDVDLDTLWTREA